MRRYIDEIPWPEGRLPNDPWSAGPKPKCRMCGNDGMVVVEQSEQGTDVAAPCPDCRLGFMCEFGYGGKTDRVTGEVAFYQDTRAQHWGERGYWVDHAEMRPPLDEPFDEDRPLTAEEMAERARRIRIMTIAVAAGGFEKNPGLLHELYRNDPEGLARDYAARGWGEPGQLPQF